MSVAEKLERLARHVPGVAGYQQRGKSHDTDRSVRLRLAGRLEEVKREIEVEQRRLTEAHALSHLATLGRLTAKIDKLTNLITYASRGYRGFFDTYKLTDAKLEQLYAFDLGLFDDVESLQVKVANLQSCNREDAAFSAAMQAVDQTLDAFEATFSNRVEILEKQ